MINLNLKPVDAKDFTVSGTDYSIRNTEHGTVYLTSKRYINKLFDLMGYGNLTTIEVLEKYAGKIISGIGDLGDNIILVDELTDSFIVTNKTFYELASKFVEWLNGNTKYISTTLYDPYHYWDEYVVEIKEGERFAVYIDFCGERVYLVSLTYDTSGNPYDIKREGQFKLKAAEDVDSLTTIISSGVFPDDHTAENLLSVDEAVRFLKLLGIVEVKKDKCFLTEKYDKVTDDNFETEIVDKYNSLTPLKRRCESSIISFFKMCEMIRLYNDSRIFWDFVDFYHNDAYEMSDIQQII